MNKIGEDITFAQLRTFVCAAKGGSFVKAADQMGISQPAVSEQISRLEQRLGHALFLRRRGSTPMLTAEGRAMLETVESILAASQDLFARKDEHGQHKKLVRLAMGPLLREAYFKPLLPAICRAHPDVEIEFEPLVSVPEGLAQLEQGDLDLMVCSVQDLQRCLPHATKVCDVPVAMIAKPGTQRQLDKGHLRLEDLNFLFPTQRNPHSEKWVGSILREFGQSIERSAKFLDCADALPNLVEDGQGVAYLIVESVADRLAAGTLEALDLPLPPMHRIIAQSPRPCEVTSSIGAMLGDAFRKAPSVLRPELHTRLPLQPSAI